MENFPAGLTRAMITKSKFLGFYGSLVLTVRVKCSLRTSDLSLDKYFAVESLLLKFIRLALSSLLTIIVC